MSMWDDEAGYDRDDPKHPDWAEAMFDKADMMRKREKEDAAFAEDLRAKDEQLASLSEPSVPVLGPATADGSESDDVDRRELKDAIERKVG